LHLDQAVAADQYDLARAHFIQAAIRRLLWVLHQHHHLAQPIQIDAQPHIGMRQYRFWLGAKDRAIRRRIIE
jgi:hypothetical protein